MKKRLLITSIVMMLVVAVALSTATYAWFTSNTSVVAKSINMTAGTSQSSALGIEWTAGESGDGFNAHYQTTVIAVDASTEQAGGFQPAAPVALNGITTAPTFHTAYINAQGEFQTTPGDTQTDVYRFANYASPAAAATASKTYSNLIHVANLAQSGPVTVYLTAQISTPYELISVSESVDTTNYDYFDTNKNPVTISEATVSSGYKKLKNEDASAVNLIRIAVYEVTESGEAPSITYTYKGLLGKTAASASNNTAVGTITATQSAANLVSTSGMKTTTELNLGTLNAQADKAYAVYVWLDGALFNEAEGGKSASVGLTFSTQKTSSGTVEEINQPQS